jgi:hypothetical protein
MLTFAFVLHSMIRFQKKACSASFATHRRGLQTDAYRGGGRERVVNTNANEIYIRKRGDTYR